ncbi:PspA/IM30 family protein [Terrihabitans sp. B22-R8]|uniref:PspA/IM30 family protein n=1 Tax=Terrihabitans sp. B22-R8 TaxID=3425128 RepID=UPI00403CE5F3
MPSRFQSALSLTLLPSPEDGARLRATLAAYREAMRLLDQTQGANLVSLHEAAYDLIRERTGLPARLVTLALRDHARHRAGDEITAIPLDAKLFAIKGPDSVSIATLEGRVILPYAMNGYHPGWNDFAEARLLFTEDAIELCAGIHAGHHPHKEEPMSNEGILARLGRVIAGVVNNAVDAAEGANPIAVAQQALREIDKISDEARSALGVAVAAGHRLKSKAEDIDAEIRDLDEKIRVGLANGREDLARAATGVQIDLEAQREALSRAVAENAGDIAEAQATLRSVASARDDAKKRLDDAQRAEKAAASHADVTPSQRNDRRLADALSAVERVTGRPARPVAGAAEIEELGQLQRQNAIEARLKAFREGER